MKIFAFRIFHVENGVLVGVNRVADVPQGFAPLPTNVSKAGLILRTFDLARIFPFLFCRPTLKSVIEKV